MRPTTAIDFGSRLDAVNPGRLLPSSMNTALSESRTMTSMRMSVVLPTACANFSAAAPISFWTAWSMVTGGQKYLV